MISIEKRYVLKETALITDEVPSMPFPDTATYAITKTLYTGAELPSPGLIADAVGSAMLHTSEGDSSNLQVSNNVFTLHYRPRVLKIGNRVVNLSKQQPVDIE